MVEINTERTAPIVDGLLNSALRAASVRKRLAVEELDLKRPIGRRGSFDSASYDFGNAYSMPAIVIDGKVFILDGGVPRPRR